jgi:hypothetical protein
MKLFYVVSFELKVCVFFQTDDYMVKIIDHYASEQFCAFLNIGN